MGDNYSSGLTVDPVACHANSGGAFGTRQMVGTVATKTTIKMARSVRG